MRKLCILNSKVHLDGSNLHIAFRVDLEAGFCMYISLLKYEFRKSFFLYLSPIRPFFSRSEMLQRPPCHLKSDHSSSAQ